MTRDREGERRSFLRPEAADPAGLALVDTPEIFWERNTLEGTRLYPRPASTFIRGRKIFTSEAR